MMRIGSKWSPNPTLRHTAPMGGTNTGWRLAGLALAWLGGVALQLNERALMALSCYVALSAVGALCLAIAWRWRRAFVFALAAAAMLGAGASGWRASERLAERLPASLEGRDLQVRGVVASLPQRSAAGLRFRFQVE